MERVECGSVNLAHFIWHGPDIVEFTKCELLASFQWSSSRYHSYKMSTDNAVATGGNTANGLGNI